MSFRGARVASFAHFLALPLASATGLLSGARGVAIAFAVLAFGYLLNAVSDRAMDRPAKTPFASGESPASALPALFLLAVVAIALSLLGPACTRVATGVSLASGVLYSIGPRLKRVPIVGTIGNVVCFAPLLWTGASDGAEPAGLNRLALCFACLLLQNQLLHEAADRDEDRDGGVHTTLLALGHRRAAMLASVVGVVAATCTRSWLAYATCALFVLAFPLVLARRGGDDRAMARARVVHRACALVAGAVLFAQIRFGW